MKFVELTEQEVRDLDFKCNNFLQSWEMYQRYRAQGRESYFVGVKSADEQILAAGLLLARPWHLGKKVFRVAGGWLMDYEHQNYSGVLEFITLKAKEFCAQKQGVALEIAPNIISQPRDAHNQIVEGADNLRIKRKLQELGYKYLGEYEQVKWTFVKDLDNEDSEEMFKAFRTDHRQRIHRAEREGVRVRELTNGELGILKQIAAEAGERHGFRDPDMEYYRSMKEAFGDKVKFVVAEIPSEKLAEDARNGDKNAKSVDTAMVKNSVQGDEVGYAPLAAAMFVNDGKEMVYLYSGSVRKLQKYGGAHLIQWEMIKEALASGCKKYNFYGVLPKEGDGVYSFKLGFRGRVEELLGTFILPIGVLGKMYVARLQPREYGEVR